MRNRIYELHKNMVAVSAGFSRKDNTKETAEDSRYNERHLDTGCDHGEWNSFVDPETDELYQKEKERSLREAEAARKAMDSLSEKQKELVMMLYGPDPITVSEYAAREGVSQPAISNRLKKIRKKLKKFL